MRAPPALPIGVILAGGRSRRFGGVDKSFLTLQGRPLIEHVMARIAPQVKELVINTAASDRRYHGYGTRLCRDAAPASPATGPLIGLTSVFDDLEARGDAESRLLSVPVDTPFLPRDLACQLSRALQATDALVAFAATAERDHPIVALWTRRSRERVRRLFQRQPNISMRELMAGLSARRVIFACGLRDPFLNVNCIWDLDAAERIAAPTDGRR